MMRRREDPAVESDPLVMPGAETTSDSTAHTFDDGVYETIVGSSQAFQFVQAQFVIIGVVLVILPLAALVLSLLGVSVRTTHAELWRASWLDPAIGALLAALVLSGTAMIVTALHARDTILVADVTGLRKRWWLGETFISWGSVGRLHVHRLLGTPWLYRVTSREGRPTIWWTASPFTPRVKPQEPHARLLEPNQMATLVVQRAHEAISPS